VSPTAAVTVRDTGMRSFSPGLSGRGWSSLFATMMKTAWLRSP
jgi:hypothetical protein